MLFQGPKILNIILRLPKHEASSTGWAKSLTTPEICNNFCPMLSILFYFAGFGDKSMWNWYKKSPCLTSQNYEIRGPMKEMHIYGSEQALQHVVLWYFVIHIFNFVFA